MPSDRHNHTQCGESCPAHGPTYPHTAAEWAEEIVLRLTGMPPDDIPADRNFLDACTKALDAYARQQVEAFRERAAQTVIGTTWELEPEERHGIAAAIRQINL
mgnify:CR=1 FL=1